MVNIQVLSDDLHRYILNGHEPNSVLLLLMVQKLLTDVLTKSILITMFTNNFSTTLNATLKQSS